MSRVYGVHPRVQQAVDWSKTHEGKKVIRFTSVSVISTVVSNAVIFIVYGLKLIPNEIYATLFGNLVATLPSYNLNRKWTWGKKGRSHFRREIVPFWSMSILGILFSIILATVAQHLIHSHHWPHLLNTILVSFANLLSFLIFWFLKMWVFNKIFKVDELAEVDQHLSREEAGLDPYEAETN